MLHCLNNHDNKKNKITYLKCIFDSHNHIEMNINYPFRNFNYLHKFIDYQNFQNLENQWLQLYNGLWTSENFIKDQITMDVLIKNQETILLKVINELFSKMKKPSYKIQTLFSYYKLRSINIINFSNSLKSSKNLNNLIYKLCPQGSITLINVINKQTNQMDKINKKNKRKRICKENLQSVQTIQRIKELHECSPKMIIPKNTFINKSLYFTKKNEAVILRNIMREYVIKFINFQS